MCVRACVAPFQSRHCCDSDKASVQGELNVIHVVGGTGLCVRGKKKDKKTPTSGQAVFDLEI